MVTATKKKESWMVEIIEEARRNVANYPDWSQDKLRAAPPAYPRPRQETSDGNQVVAQGKDYVPR